MESSPIPRVMKLLDEAKDDIVRITGLAANTWPEEAARAHDKITQAQNLLVGADPVRPEDN